MTHLFENAVRYAANGWPVFMLGRSKRPLANCDNCPPDSRTSTHDRQACKCLTCHGFYAATLDPKTIRRMLALTPRGMLAIRTGTASGLVVIDVDPDSGGTTSLKTLIAQGLIPPTRYVRTGSGGLHLYYRHPGPHQRILSTNGKVAAGIDIKADGGYVVAPPSMHPRARKPYLWADERVAIEEMAPPLARLYLAPSPTPAPAAPASSTPTSAGAGAISHPDRLLDALLHKVRTAPPGRRRVTLYGCARGVARIVATGAINAADAQAALLEMGLAVGQTERSALAAITGGFHDEGVSS